MSTILQIEHVGLSEKERVVMKKKREFSGEVTMFYNASEKTYCISLGTYRDNIPCPAHALVRITSKSIENPIIFEASITKNMIKKETGYFVKNIRVPLRFEKLIPRDLKSINYQLEIIPQG